VAIPRSGLSDKLRLFLRGQNFRDSSQERGSAQLVMLRGCKINADKSLSLGVSPEVYTNRYDDVLVVFGTKEKGQPYLEAFRASAKPGLEWIRSPQYAGSGCGCPTVQPGQYQYVRGLHRGHEALRQRPGCPVVVVRDLDQDAKLELSDRVDYPTTTGINIHAGGTSERVGWNSSGCQVLWGGWNGPWVVFHDLVYRVAKKQEVFYYTVVDFEHFAKWHDAGRERWKYEWLMFGSYGRAVEQLQAALAQRGYYGKALVDGEFGRVTDEGVRAYQRKAGLRPTGIVTPGLLQRLRSGA